MSLAMLAPLAFAIPALAAAVAWHAEGPGAPRGWAIGGAALTLGATSALLARTLAGGATQLAIELAGMRFEADGASVALAATAALVTLGVLVFAPRRRIDARLAAAVLAGEAGTMLALFSRSPLLFAAGWALSMVPLLSARSRAVAGMARVATVISLAALAIALSLSTADAHGPLGPAASIAWLVAVLARAGVPPVHGWAPVAMHRAPVALAAPAVLSPLPVLALARLTTAAPLEGWVATLLVVLGVVGAVRGALLAMIQQELRRALGHLHVSVVAIWLTAIGSASEAGASGALLGSVTASVALSGLALLASAVESRSGTGDMRALGGLQRSMPLGGAIFLLSGVALVGLPGTIGFIAEDLVMQGLVPRSPVVAIVLLAAVALNAVTLFRCYKRTFLGPHATYGGAPAEVEDLLPRERAVVVLWAALLVIGGFAPAPLVAIQTAIEGEREAAPVSAPPPRSPA